MSTLWLTILLVAAVSIGFKALGPAVLGDRQLPDRAVRVIALLAPALLAGLIVTDIAGRRWEDLDWTLCAGLGVVALAHRLRAPSLVAIGLGVLVTAGLRLVVQDAPVPVRPGPAG